VSLPWVAIRGERLLPEMVRHAVLARFRRHPVPKALHLRTAYAARLRDEDATQAAAIAVERIRCPLLLLSGEDDQMWPASEMAAAAMSRRGRADDRHLSFADAGHFLGPRSRRRRFRGIARSCQEEPLPATPELRPMDGRRSSRSSATPLLSPQGELQHPASGTRPPKLNSAKPSRRAPGALPPRRISIPECAKTGLSSCLVRQPVPTRFSEACIPWREVSPLVRLCGIDGWRAG